jgi:tetratricopeptide (TPR) repeat protein
VDDELALHRRRLIDAAMAEDIPPPAIVEDSWGMVVAQLTADAAGSGTASSDAMNEALVSIGARVGKYVVLGTIGQGAMGVVVRGYDPDLEREVAIKVVRPQGGDEERFETARGRLLAEARALARISHPHVVAVYEVGLHEGHIFVAMELVDGVDLDAWLRAQSRSWREIVAAFEAAARGLAEVHAVGLVHRDVKPTNILVGRDGRVRIGDFGVARATLELAVPMVDGRDLVADAIDLDTTALTREGHVVGTPSYMAPEQHVGAEIGPAADQYALCVALYEALWGRRPFAMPVRRLLAAKQAGVREPDFAHGVPPWVVAIVLRGLSFDPSDRFASMAELAAALRADPSLRRRRWVAFAGGGAAVATAIGIAIAISSRPGPCVDAGDALVGAWDPTTRAAIADAFARSDRPWAASAWGYAEPRLQTYAAAWTDMRREACEATHVRGEQSPELMDRRMACLEARRRVLAATTEILVAGDGSAVDHTFDLLARLRPLDPCADPIALASLVELPDDPDARDAVDVVRTDLARARALVDAGRYGEALELVQHSVTAARELAYEPVVAEALAFEGEALLRVGEGDAARTSLEASLWTAIGVGHDEAAAEAASGLVWVAGQHARSLPEAQRWSALALATLRRVGSEDPNDFVQVENALGAALQGAAHYDEALLTFERALARVADDPDRVTRAATMRHNIAKHWIDRGELGKARDVLEPAIAALAEVLGSDHPRVVAMRGTLGQVFGASGDHARAAELFRAEVEGMRIALGDDAPAVAHARNNLAVELGRLGRADEAIAVTELALAAFERAGDESGAATCHVNLGDDLLARGDDDEAKVHFEEALRRFERVYPDGHPDLLYPLVGLGRVGMAQKRYDDALASYQRADRIMLASEDPSGSARGLALEGIGAALRALGRRPEALASIAQQIEVLRAAGDVAPDELPFALSQHARLLCELGRFDEALRDADEARRLAVGLDRVLAMAELERACALDGLGREPEAREAEATASALDPPR